MQKTLLILILVNLALGQLADEHAAAGPPQPARLLDARFLRDYAETRGFMLGRPVKAQPTPDGKSVIFLRSPARSPVMHLYEFDIGTKATRALLTPEQLLAGAEEQLSPEEKARRERMRVSVRGITDFALSPDGSLVLVSLSGKLYTFSRHDGNVQELPTGMGTLLDPKFSPDGTAVSYVLDYDVYVMHLATRRERRATTGGNEDVSHGLAEFVAQEEMERFTGYWWSPDSQWIVYEEADAREVETWWVSDPAEPGQPPYAQRYPRPGKNNVRVRLGVIRIPAAAKHQPAEESPIPNTVWVDWDSERYPYLATVKWDEGSPLTVLVQSRDQQEMILLAVNHETGKTTRLLQETDGAWLNLDQDVPRWLSDGSGFLWTSESASGPRLELRDAAGSLVRVLVAPDFGYLSPVYEAGLFAVDEKARQVYFRASQDPTQAHLFRISLDGGVPEKLSDEPGLHSAVFAEDHSVYVERSSGPRFMPQTMVYHADGEPIAELPSVAEEPPLASTNTEIVQVGEGRNYYCSLTRPQDFDAQDRYPIIVDVYAGPGFRVVTAAMQSYLLDQWLADQGFVVVSIDGRGTPGRGRAWERAVRGSFGQIPLDDQIAGLKALGKRYPELDLSRVGITGWSFGGYMSALAVLRRPDVFKAAVAGAPVTDWEDYDTHYTERYLGLPQENPAGYRESSLLTYAADLQRPLLLIHGTNDDNVFFLHSLKLSNALFRAGKEHEVLALSGFTHMVPDPMVRRRLHERIVQFFREHLCQQNDS